MPGAGGFYDQQWTAELTTKPPPLPWWKQRHTLDRFTHAAQLLGSGRRLLDVGCGLGDLLEKVGPHFHERVGVDVSSVALAHARRRLGESVDLAEHDLETPLPFPDESFDAVACIAVAEHVFDVYGLVDELVRVLERGGALVFEVPNLAYLRHRLRLVAGRLPQTSDLHGRDVGWDGGHLHYFTADTLRRQLLEPAGLEVEIVSGSGVFAAARQWRPSLLCGDLMVRARRA